MRWKHEQHYASALVVLQYLNGMKEKIIDAQNAKAYIQLLDSLICQMKNI
jgi:hypothetical protein